MKFIVCENYDEVSKKGATIIASQVNLKPNSVLGLATGLTPIGLYQNLVKMCNENLVSFKKVITYNLDEYYPISPKDKQSYRYFMDNNLFNHIDINKDNTHLLNGLCKDVNLECKEYDEKILKDGGIDLMLLGIGHNGHIGFNEPFKTLFADTHLTKLADETVRTNSKLFPSESLMPKSALTMGMGTILKSKKIVLLASGKNKYNAISSLMNSDIDTFIPATLLKTCNDVSVICDKAAFNG